MDSFTPFSFSPHERKLISYLKEEGIRPRDLMRTTHIPHASLYWSFNKLCQRGLASRYIKKGKIFWKKEGRIEKLQQKKEAHVLIHTSKEEVRKCIEQVLRLESGERVFIVEGTQEESGWFGLFSKEETIILNRALSTQKIICESILPESYFRDALPRLGREWALSYAQRPVITYVVKNGLISSNALLIVLRNKAVLLYAKEVFAIEIRNQEIVFLIRGMIEAIKTNARKVSIGKDFSFDLR